jgi:hypothetical protein
MQFCLYAAFFFLPSFLEITQAPVQSPDNSTLQIPEKVTETRGNTCPLTAGPTRTPKYSRKLALRRPSPPSRHTDALLLAVRIDEDRPPERSGKFQSKTPRRTIRIFFFRQQIKCKVSTVYYIELLTSIFGKIKNARVGFFPTLKSPRTDQRLWIYPDCKHLDPAFRPLQTSRSRPLSIIAAGKMVMTGTYEHTLIDSSVFTPFTYSLAYSLVSAHAYPTASKPVARWEI